jgi:hypothetical protein
MVLVSASTVLLVGEAAVVAPGAGSRQPVSLSQDFDTFYAPGVAGAARGTVTVSQTSDLVRQRVKVSWSGLRPTRGEAYPVAIMQCWGAADAVNPQRCWSSGRGMEPATFTDNTPWDPVVFGDFGDPGANLSTVMSFTTREGTRYSWDQVSVNPQTGIPDAWPNGSVKPGGPPDLSQDTNNFVQPPTLRGETRADGTGAVDIELLPSEQLPSLGCSDTNVCSLVVVPIGDPHCMPPDQLPLEEWAAACQPNADASSFRDATTWKTPTNWSRRFAFPLSFRKSPAVCSVDNRAETGLTGSPYLGQLMASWRPKFCLDTSLFKLGYTSLGEGDARRQFATNLTERRADGVNAVLTSRPPDTPPPGPVVYAPIATTGFTVGFVLDNFEGAEVTTLNLTPRLLLKLLTQSYTAKAPGIETHPAISANPVWWGDDPELARANPGLKIGGSDRFSSTYPLLVQGDLDLTHALTSYIVADPAAMAWLRGAPDEWGMVINPKFSSQKLPYSQIELRDDWRVPDNATSYRGQIWFNLAANQVSSIIGAAVALVQARPTATTNETIDNGKLVYKRPERQQTGRRSLIAITDAADTSVFGLRTAKLQTPTGEFVAPDRAAMAYGLRATTVDEKTGILAVDQSKLAGQGYPGTTVVYAGIPTSGLARAEADNYATLLDYAAGTGQQYGVEIGNLPEGYLALSDPLREQTRNAARAVREQKGDVPPPPKSVIENPAGGLVPPLGSAPVGNAVAGNNPPPAQPGAPSSAPPGAATPSSAAQPVTSAATRAETSAFARWILPVLLGIGLLAAVLAPLVPAIGTPDHPVRRWLRGRFGRGSA